MIHIFIPFKCGQALMPEVMKAIVSQSVECCVFPISSDVAPKSYHCEANKTENLFRAVNLNVNDYLLTMDSDVVLGDETIIDQMFKQVGDIITLKTNGNNQGSCHSVTLIRGMKLKMFKDFLVDNKDRVNEGMCIMCAFVGVNGGCDIRKS